MSEAIARAGLTDQVGCFIDDLATGGADHASAAANTGLMLQMLEDNHLLASAQKVFLGLAEVRFLGFLLKDESMLPDPAKTEAIDRLLPPETRSEVRGFLGITGYYRDFIFWYSHLARPLTLLLKEDTPWAWGPPCQTAFQTLKGALTSAPLLALPDHDRPYTIHTDYSH